MKRTLDFIDHQIIGLLQKNARMSLKDIASGVYLSSPAASARLEKLKREGYITGFHASINHEMMGYNIKAFITLSVDSGLKDEFLDHMRRCGNVIECNCITGDYAMLLEVVYPNTEELERFVAKLQKYGKTKTQIVFSTAVEHREPTPDVRIERAG
ncbi:Leucine-responsive regulatory protein [Eubacterium plexicaudatum ASF492]|uniref:HTH asnC-type domain-containing protein n=1 Tax=Eubacterium plexicaudatum ASF492 TaxID=1235802 RepID=N2AI80_9FIRM|nr:Leucine-responsive regulatory protein [Eubacterium plexicaudatum ASF492]